MTLETQSSALPIDTGEYAGRSSYASVVPPLSVLVIVASTARRGAEIEGVELAQALSGRGHAARLAAIVTGSPTELSLQDRDLDPASVQVEVLGQSRWSPRSHRRIRSLARASDVVVAMGSITLLASAVAMTGLGRPLVCRSIGDPEIWAGRGFRRWRTKLYFRSVDRIATLSEHQHAQYESLYGVDAAKLAVVPNSRSPVRFRPPSRDQRTAARSALGLGADDKVVAFVGSLTAEKRIELAIAAFAELPGDYVLLVAGEGSDRHRAEVIASTLGEGRVRFLGRVDDVVPLYHASDVVLLTSSTEGVPGVLIEAGLCGLATVSTDVGLVADVVRDGSTGCLAGDHTPASIAGAVERAYAGREQMGAAAREWCSTKFSSDSAIRLWEDLLSSAISR